MEQLTLTNYPVSSSCVRTGGISEIAGAVYVLVKVFLNVTKVAKISHILCMTNQFPVLICKEYLILIIYSYAVVEGLQMVVGSCSRTDFKKALQFRSASFVKTTTQRAV